MSHDVGHLQNPTHLTRDAVDLSAPARPQRVRRRHAPRQVPTNVAENQPQAGSPLYNEGGFGASVAASNNQNQGGGYVPQLFDVGLDQLGTPFGLDSSFVQGTGDVGGSGSGQPAVTGPLANLIASGIGIGDSWAFPS